jgi:hypothetical protein
MPMDDGDDIKYEIEDFSPRGIRWFTAGLAVLAVMVLLSMGGLLWFLSGGWPPRQGIVSPMVPAPNMSPEPDLQVASSRDYQEMRAAEEAQLHSYRWVDREAGIAAIPIKRAMELLASRGMPGQKPPTKGTQSKQEQP